MEVSIKADVPRTGVHPMKLPLFSQSIQAAPPHTEERSKSHGKLQSVQLADTRRHWEFRAGYVAKPAHASRIQMLQDRKYWAKNDPLLLGDLTLDENPQIDSFKAVHFAKPPPKEVTGKTTQNHFAPSAPTRPGRVTKLRFSEVAVRSSKIKGRLFDNLPKARDSEKDFEPLYSSFAPNAQFRPPVSSKDVLQKKLLQRQRGLLGNIDPAKDRAAVMKAQDGGQSRAEAEGKGAAGAAAGAVNFSGASGTGTATTPEATGEIPEPKVAYADQAPGRASAEELPLPMVTQTLFKRVQSQQALPGAGQELDFAVTRKAAKAEQPDPAATTTTAAGTATKLDPSDNAFEQARADLERQESAGNLAASAPPRRGSQRDGALYSTYVDILAQTAQFGAIKTATAVGVRTNGFSQHTFPSQVWEQQTRQAGRGGGRK